MYTRAIALVAIIISCSCRYASSFVTITSRPASAFCINTNTYGSRQCSATSQLRNQQQQQGGRQNKPSPINNLCLGRLQVADSSSAESSGETSSPSSNSNSDNNSNLLIDKLSLNHDYFCLRHGQSEANVAKIIASSPKTATKQYGLSDVGKQQAENAVRDIIEQFKKEENKYGGILILSSDLLRAKETAEIVQERLQSLAKVGRESFDSSYISETVIIEKRLRERWFGDWDLTSDENYHKVWEDDAKDGSHTNHNVESVQSVMNRVTSMIIDWDTNKIESKNDIPGSRMMVICVAHGDVLQILQTSFLKMDGSQHRTVPHLETATLRPLTLNSS